MAKRRNAPALFELLRESNSTRTGQVGNEDMRSQIGAGVVKNSAPRPPGHPAVIAEAQAVEQAKVDAVKAEQAKQEAKAQAKLQAEVKSGSVDERIAKDQLGIEMDSLMSMPEFKAGRVAASKPEPESTSQPTTKNAQALETKSVLKTASEPMSKIVSEPEPDAAPKPIGPPRLIKSNATSITSRLKKKPEAKAMPPADVPMTESASKVDVTSEIETKPKTSQSRAVSEPIAKPIEESVEKPAVATEQKKPEKPAAKIRGQQIKVGGNQIELTPVKLGIFGAFILLLFFAMFVVGSWAGRSELQKEQEPQLREAAEKSLQDFDGMNGQDDRLIDPLQLAQDAEFVLPSVVDSPQTTPEQVPESTPETSTPEQILNEDTRVEGSNYLHLAPLADSEEARRLQIFLAEYGIQSYIRVGPRSGRTVHELITLVGIPSEGWSTSTEKLSHVREIRRLGGIWFKEHGGSIDYSRANQSQWYKAPPR
jgi:hypothetical protein